MNQWYFWILSAATLYFAVHFSMWFYRKFFRSSYHHKASHLILITGNNQQSIEWLIRSYKVANRMGSNSIKVTVLDTGSTDDTLKIVNLLRKEFDQLELISLRDLPNTDEVIQHFVQMVGKEKKPFLVLDLRQESSDEQEQTSA